MGGKDRGITRHGGRMHILEMADGRLLEGQEAVVGAAGEAIGKANRVVIHAHGGLVSASRAKVAAAELARAYAAAGAISLFPVWHSDFATSLKSALDGIDQDRAFQRLVRRLCQLALGLLGPPGRGGELPFGERGLSEDEPSFVQRLDDHDADLAPASFHQLTDDELDWVTEQLSADTDLVEIESKIAGGEPAAMDRGPQEQIACEHEGRAVVATLVLARKGATILAKVVSRFLNGRHHGVYDTVVQEVLRELYFDSVGQILWNAIKASTSSAFARDPAHGGHALLMMLKSNWHEALEVTLVGHSAGSIFHTHLLESACKLLPADCRFGLVLEAPAVSFRLLHDRLQVFERLTGLRIFNLNNAVESTYWEVPVLSRGSLLYLVAGLLEEEVDEPLLGMQRYFTNDVYQSLEPVREVRARLPEGPVWSPSDQRDGFRTMAEKHGAFQLDPATLSSVQYIIEHGFRSQD